MEKYLNFFPLNKFDLQTFFSFIEFFVVQVNLRIISEIDLCL
jgi:hypothetical protein